MVYKMRSVSIAGVDVQPVIIETDVSNGLPGFDMVGLLSSDIKEARERVRTAIKNSGFMLPPKRITINFSPGNIHKSGTYFDLSIAVSILQAMGIVMCDTSECMLIGELGLNGDVVMANGVLPMVLCAKEQGIKRCFVPITNVGECSLLEGIEVVGVESLKHAIMILNGKQPFTPAIKQENSLDSYEYDFCNIKGQSHAKRAAEICAAGMHNLLMMGPPGTGKSIIAKAIPSILPDMSESERIEISKIQSIAGNLKGGLSTRRPFRNPHHTVTVSAMIGRGVIPKPGEISLAHGGILYMDEFPEFSRGVIETLRQPLEEKQIVVSRAGGNYVFPANCILVASMNPCRCGYYPDRNRCSCTEHDVLKYQEKISGPILDRIDICVQMEPVKISELQSTNVAEDSRTIKERINNAVQIQRERYKGTGIGFNGELDGKDINKYCYLNKKERKLMEDIFEQFKLSVRAYQKIIKVARTISDLKGVNDITTAEIAEAVSFKVFGG